MKYYIQSILLSLCLFSATSCKSFLEVEPTNVQAVSTFDDVRDMMGSHLYLYPEDGYWGMKGTSLFFKTYGDKDYMILYFYSDDYNSDKYLNNWGAKNNKGEFYKSLDWKNPHIHESIWSRNFRNIGFYNMIIEELGKHANDSQEKQEQVLAEAKVLRAWSFFTLMQLYVPYNIAKLGLPLNTSPDKIATYEGKRKTQKENYDFVINELEEVLNYKSKPSKTYNIFFDKRIIQGLLAQVYHYKGGSAAKEDGDYDKAITYAKSLLASGISFDVINPLPEANDNFGMHKEKSYSPLVFIRNEYDYHQNTVGNPYYSLYQYASDDLYQLFDDNDKRKEQYFDEQKRIVRYTKSAFPYAFYQWTFLSGAEMQLIIAESYARQGKDAEALQALNAFTATRYTKYEPKAELSLLDKILIERRKEFCYEYCMRWIDLTRLQTGFSRKAIDKKEGGTYTLKDGDYRFTLPIPRMAELKDNKIEQNPNWNNF